MLTGTYQAPPKTAAGQLELNLRWAPEGKVLFRNIELKETDAPAPRKVRLAAINHRPRNSPGPQANLEAFGKLVEQAAGQKADIVCLPEGITVVGTKYKYADVAEPIPGPSTEFLGKLAAKDKLYIVAGLYEREGEAVYNTSVLIGRDGRLVGKYRKVCLPREEIDGGITPGTEYPVFDTDFGRVGMMICWDVHFPEVARELSARGAEVILMPIWGGNETLAKARAIENQVHLVASGYDFRTAIYNKAGDAVTKADADPAVLVTEVDLNDRLLWPWLGDWRPASGARARPGRMTSDRPLTARVGPVRNRRSRNPHFVVRTTPAGCHGLPTGARAKSRYTGRRSRGKRGPSTILPRAFTALHLNFASENNMPGKSRPTCPRTTDERPRVLSLHLQHRLHPQQHLAAHPHVPHRGAADDALPVGDAAPHGEDRRRAVVEQRGQAGDRGVFRGADPQVARDLAGAAVVLDVDRLRPRQEECQDAAADLRAPRATVAAVSQVLFTWITSLGE